MIASQYGECIAVKSWEKGTMKKRVLKKWLENLIIVIQVILIMLLGAECDNLAIFFISKLIFVSIFLLNHLILCKFTDLFDGLF